MWLVVGLGNPGPAYAGHRHNAGYLVVEELASRMGLPSPSGRTRPAGPTSWRAGWGCRARRDHASYSPGRAAT